MAAGTGLSDDHANAQARHSNVNIACSSGLVRMTLRTPHRGHATRVCEPALTQRAYASVSPDRRCVARNHAERSVRLLAPSGTGLMIVRVRSRPHVPTRFTGKDEHRLIGAVRIDERTPRSLTLRTQQFGGSLRHRASCPRCLRFITNATSTRKPIVVWQPRLRPGL
jgi:hypothetical protein